MTKCVRMMLSAALALTVFVALSLPTMAQHPANQQTAKRPVQKAAPIQTKHAVTSRRASPGTRQPNGTNQQVKGRKVQQIGRSGSGTKAAGPQIARPASAGVGYPSPSPSSAEVLGGAVGGVIGGVLGGILTGR
jgi:hypothetical protein